jgi:hypothetical protein
VAEDVDGAGGGVEPERRDPQEGGLAGPVGAEHDPPLAGTDDPVDVGQQRARVPDDGDAGQGQGGRRDGGHGRPT